MMRLTNLPVDDPFPFASKLLDKVAALVLIVNPAGQIVHINRAGEQATGYASREVEGQPWWEVLLPHDEAHEVQSWMQAQPLRPPAGQVGNTWVTKDQRRRHIAWSAEAFANGDGKTRFLVITGIDITEQLETEDALKDSEALHRITLSSISDAVFITNEAGELTYVCPNVHVIFGYSYEEARALETIDRILGDGFYDPQELTRRGEIENLERRVADKNGQAHDLLVNVKRVAIQGGTVLLTCRDVTARKQVEDALREYQLELAHATRMSTMGEIASGLAHELNQPLSAISNFAKACIHRTRSGRSTVEDLLEDLELISQQAHRAGEIIRRLRTLIRKQAPEQTTTDLSTVVEEAFALAHGSRPEQGIAMSLHKNPAATPICVDVIGLQQVVLNLIRNAIDAMSEHPAPDHSIRVEVAQHNEHEACVRVADNGPGLAPEMEEHIFEPFFTTKAKGIGLGLSISRTIVEMHGGRLSVAPNPDRGVTFEFTVPTLRGAEHHG